MDSLIGSGSPLEARSSPFPYTILFIAIIVIAFFFVLWIFLRILKKRRQTPEYLEMLKNRPTTLKDCQALAKRIDLTNAEALQLFNICRKEKKQNIYYTWTDNEAVDQMFKNEYQRQMARGASADETLAMFKLRSRMERILLVTKSFSSTHNIPAGETLSFTVFGGIEYQFKVLKNEKENLILDMPIGFEKMDFCPKPLTRIILTYVSPNNLKHVISTRVIRFQSDFSGERQLVIQHSSTISMQARRRYKRVSVGRECFFRSVIETRGKRGEVKYSPKENKYEGLLADISAGGCMIKTKIPIKKNQKLWVEMDLSNGNKIECCGHIVAMTQNMDMYSLHIAFVDISNKDRNKIFNFVYKYD